MAPQNPVRFPTAGFFAGAAAMSHRRHKSRDNRLFFTLAVFLTLLTMTLLVIALSYA